MQGTEIAGRRTARWYAEVDHIALRQPRIGVARIAAKKEIITARGFANDKNRQVLRSPSALIRIAMGIPANAYQRGKFASR